MIVKKCDFCKQETNSKIKIRIYGVEFKIHGVNTGQTYDVCGKCWDKLKDPRMGDM